MNTSDSGYRTKSKIEIMRFLEENSDKRVSVADIIEHLSKNGNRVNRTTVYRNLERMSNNGLIMKYKTSDMESMVYQFVKNHDNCHKHLHLQCEKCGKIIHLECDFMNIISEHLVQDHGFLLECDGSVLLGLCRDCRNS